MAEWNIVPDNEGGIYIPFDLAGREFLGTQENTHVYTHGEPYKDVDHLWLMREKKKHNVGMFVFRQVVPDFDALAQLLLDNDFYRIHAPTPNEGDLNAWIKFEAGREEERPDWLDGGANESGQK